MKKKPNNKEKGGPSMASRKEYEMLFQLNAQLGSSYHSTFRSAMGSIASMQQELQALNKTQSDIAAYQKQQNAVEATRKRLEVLQQQYDNIQQEIDETGTFSATLENRLLSKQLQIDKTSASLSNQISKLEQMRNALREAGINTEDLSGETEKLTSKIDELRQKQEEVADEARNYGAVASAAFGAVQQAIAAAGIVTVLKEIKDLYSEAIEASISFESAMTGVAKTTDLTDEELAAMGEEIKALTLNIPIVAEELAGIGEVAGQLGIAKENLLDFSTVMAMLSTATTMTAEESATMLAQFANITQMDPSYYSNLASAIVDLGNNFATTEQKIIEMAQGIAASASLAGMSEADMLALSAAVTSLGIETQAGSTSMSKLISELMKAVETGEKLDEFASIANMTANEFSEVWGRNAVEALQAFVLGLADTERTGKSAIVILEELGITESRMQRMILSLANSGDMMNRTLDTASRAWAENTALAAEAEKRYATTQSQLIMMQNAYNNLKIAIGDNFTPVLRELYSAATDILTGITEFVQQNPKLVKTITAFIGVIGTATAGITAYVAITKVAAAVSAAFTATIPGVGFIMGAVTGLAALTASIAAFVGEAEDAKREIQALTAASREQYYQLEEMRREYEKVCATMGETSAEAQLLKRKLDEAEDAFEANKLTAEEFAAAQQEVIDAHNELMAAYEETVVSLDDQATSVTNLMNKLEELMAVEGKSAAVKQEILTIVDMLNEAMPELGLAYDQYADSLNMSADAIRALVEAEIAREQNAAKYEQLKKFIAEEGKLYDNLQRAMAETAAAERELADTKAKKAEIEKELDAALKEGRISLSDYGRALAPYQAAVNEAAEVVKEAAEAERIAQEAYDENQAVIKELTEAMAGYTEQVANSGGEIRNVITGITGKMEELAAEYEKTYDAALDSVSGQYKLWDKASEVVATAAWKINDAMESQVKYWQDYNKNLASLRERSADIEGLADMIASFADGSESSVNAIAGMAKASDEELRKMVSNWQKLQEEQMAVADTIAELETDFSNSMNALQAELETAIKDMDLSEQAAQSGKNTIQGFISGAEELLPAVEKAYAQIADAAIKAIDEKLQIHSPSKVFAERGEYAMSGFVGGVVSMEPEVVAVMSQMAKESIRAFSPESAISAEPGAPGGDYIVLTVSPAYYLTGAGAVDTAALESLHSHNENLRELILDILEEAGIDAKRRAYG